MRVTIEGNLTLEEMKELVQAVQRIEQHDPRRVVSLLFHEAPVESPEEWMAFCMDVGLPHVAIVPLGEETELLFDRGGGVRLVPQDPTEPELSAGAIGDFQAPTAPSS